MLKIVQATEADIEHVAAHLGQRTLDELAVLGQTDLAEIRKDMFKFSSMPWSYAIRDGDEPVAFFGGAEVAPGLVRTWLRVTENLARSGIGATKLLRWFVAEQAKANPDLTIEIATASPHANADTWLRLLRFQLYAEEPPVRYYRAVGNC